MVFRGALKSNGLYTPEESELDEELRKTGAAHADQRVPYHHQIERLIL